MGMLIMSRRRFVLSSAMSFAGLMLAGCDKLSESGSFRSSLSAAELLTLRGQRLLIGGQALAREYSLRDLSQQFPSNGTTLPQDEDYKELAADGFQTWRLIVDGLVERPATYTLSELRRCPPDLRSSAPTVSKAGALCPVDRRSIAPSPPVIRPEATEPLHRVSLCRHSGRQSRERRRRA